MASVPKINLQIPQGATYVHTFTYEDATGVVIDITGYTARCQLRAVVTSASNFHEATTENGGIALGGVAGTVILTITAADTAAFTVSKAVYDIELIAPNNTVERVVKGSIRIDPEVTR
jgi:hypothetical protein